MNEKNIGYNPETAINVTSHSEMPKLRSTEQRAKTLENIIKLTPFDQGLYQMPEELLHALATKMASKGISAESFNY